MIADNFLHIKRNGKIFEVYEGLSSDDKLAKHPLGYFKTLNQAVKFAQEYEKNNAVEYGIRFDI